MLLAFIVVVCLTTTSRAEDEALVDTPVDEIDAALEYDGTIEETISEETQEVIDAVEEVLEATEEVVEPTVEEEDVKEVIVESEIASVPSITAKISEITNKLKTQLSQQDAKKFAAVGLGAWGAATGIGWIAEKLGKPIE